MTTFEVDPCVDGVDDTDEDDETPAPTLGRVVLETGSDCAFNCHLASLTGW